MKIHYFSKMPDAKKEKLTHLIGRMIAKDLLPYSIVEQEGFTEVLQFLCPEYKLPCAITFMNSIIPQIYVKERQKLQNIITKEFLHGSITTDGWSSRNQQHFTTLSLHYITEDFLLRSFTLEMKPTESKSSEVQQQFIQEKLSTWNINRSNIVAGVTDNEKAAIKSIVKIFIL
jgi:hypothetical protein